MTTHSRRPIEVFSSRRRASTANSTGLNYQTCYRVEEDILSRIRSLLLSRNGHCPPRTPCTSDEDRKHHSGRCSTSDISDRFDFSTAKSVTRLLVRTESSGLAFPVTPHLRSRTTTSRMDIARKPTQPSVPIQRRPLRATSSTNDLIASLDDAALHAAVLPCCPPCPPEDTKKSFRLPRLALRDQSVKKKRDLTFRSCIDFTPRDLPTKDASPKKLDIPCCPPSNPSAKYLPTKKPSNEIDPPRRLSGKIVKAEPADLACFLAGCGPGECKTHSRRSSQPISPKEKNGVRAVDKDIADGIAKLGLTVTGVKQFSTTVRHSKNRLGTSETLLLESGERPVVQPTLSNRTQGFQMEAEEPDPISARPCATTSRSASRDRLNEYSTGQKAPGLANGPSSLKSITSSTFSLDAFPHVMQSQEMAAKAVLTQPLSSIIVTNFSLPGPKAKINQTEDATKPKQLGVSLFTASGSAQSEPPGASLSRITESIPTNDISSGRTNSVRVKKSDASMRSKPYSISLHSGASKAASIRHALLKPSISVAESVDTGLPVPPVLTEVAVSALESETATKANTSPEKAGGEAVVLEDLENATKKLSGSEEIRALVDLYAEQNKVEVISHLTSLKKAKDLAARIKDRSSEATGSTKNVMLRDESHATTIQLSAQRPEALENSLKSSSEPGNDVDASLEPVSKSIISLKGLLGNLDTVTQPLDSLAGADPRKPACCPDPVKPSRNASETNPRQVGCCPGFTNQVLRGVPMVDPVNAAYWGLVPAVRGAVQDAVQVAVRRTVEEIIVPPGIEQNEASQAYRKLVEDSLAEAARDADKYLRRASLLNEAPSSIRERSERTFDLPVSTAGDREHLTVGEAPVGGASPGTNYRLGDLDQICGSERNSPRYYGQVGIMPRGFESCENLIPPVHVSPDNLETVPLETVDERLVENHKQGWKSSSAWAGLKRSSGYTAVPTRSSSKNRALHSKNRTTPDSSVKESPKGSRSPKPPMEQQRSRPTGGLRSVSSVGSLQSFESVGKDQVDEQESTIKGLTDANTDQIAGSKKSSKDTLARKNTIQWLRELLSTNEPYETRLTALPPRKRWAENSSTGRIRSQTAPANPITNVYLGATPRPDQQEGTSKIVDTGEKPGVEEEVGITTPDNGNQKTAALTRAFAKTINDLEFLLNEALFIARQAAEKDGSSYAPRLLGKAAAVLKGGRKGLEDDIVRRMTLETRGKARRYGQKRSDNISSIASMHESFGSFTSSDSNSSDESGHGRLRQEQPPKLCLQAPTVGIVVSTELTQTSHHDAGWPPTGRVPTPYPPGSIAPSPMESAGESTSPQGEGGSESMDCTPKALLATTIATTKGLTGAIRQDPDPDIPIVQIKDINPFLTENFGNMRRKSSISAQISPTKRSRSTTGRTSRQTASCVIEDFAFTCTDPKKVSGPLPMPPVTPRSASLTQAGKRRATQTDPELIFANFPTESVPSKQEVREYIRVFHHPPIQPRASSLNLRKEAEKEQIPNQGLEHAPTGRSYSWQDIDWNAMEPCSQEAEIPDAAQTRGLAKPDLDHDHATSISQSFDGTQSSEAIHFDSGFAHRQKSGGGGGRDPEGREAIELRDNPSPNLPQVTRRGGKGFHMFNLKGRNHISLRGENHKGFSFARTHKKPKIARDWAPARKRFVASAACISTALVGLLVGIYAAEVPAIQYWIVDFHHYTILGNVFFFIGLSIPTFFFWPLPLLHGRKPYTLGAMSLAMPLIFPQALAVGQFRSPYVDYWRIGLILPRALMGFVLGFANMNFKATLLDLFGASLQSENPHQEVVDQGDVRRHGGGLGVWLGIWTWCAIGSIGVGFLIGAIIINHANPAWGFYISIAIIAGVLFLNVLCPEVRRSAFRRSVAEMKHEGGVSRRLGRGEVKMHMVQTGPRWWGEEFHYGVMLNAKMLRQPGFMVLAIYVSWIYGQIVLLVVLLGSLTSKYYKFKSPYVGACTMAVPVGAFLAIPFQKASLFSRSRSHAELEDDNAETLNQKVTLSSHLVRRAIFILVLPFAGLGYTLSSKGPPIPFIVPILFAGLIGFLSNLAMGECHGIIMETFDTSDLQPGMTGRARNSDKPSGKRTNYSSFPRVSSGFAITQGIGYLFAAAATGVGGVAERNIGQQAATGVMAGILLILSLLLLGVLFRFRDVQIIPNSKQEDMRKWKNTRRTSAVLRTEDVEQAEEWRPIIIGNPTHTMRRMCILELGGMTRWSEIRRKNHLVDQNTLEAKHPNLAMIRDVEHRIKAAEEEIIHHVRRSISRHSLSRNSSRRSKRSDQSYDQPGDLGGHREMLHPSGNGSRKRERGKSRIEE